MPEECQREALECFVPSYMRTFAPRASAARFHSSRRVFAIQRRSPFRLVGFGKSAGESAQAGPPRATASRRSRRRQSSQSANSSSIGIQPVSPVFVPPIGALAFGPFAARPMRSPGTSSRSCRSAMSSARISPGRTPWHAARKAPRRSNGIRSRTARWVAPERIVGA